MDRRYELLSKYFGFRSFRKGQEEIIDALMNGRDVFGIMPTGGGKSMCYQLPALMMKGVTIVVSPLISLMKDQVLSLKNAGISAAYINSSLTPLQLRKVYGYMSEMKYKIIYVAPERLMTEGFLSVIKDIHIALVAVDEAHCISQWGQDFRPAYLKIPQFIEALSYRPVLAAFTATATKQVQTDTARLLGLRDPYKLITGFDRPNLYFDVLRSGDKMKELIRLLGERKNKSGIVYCSTRKDVERVAEELNDRGFSATRYHAGLSDEERRENQDEFIFDRKSIMIATNAFGMGIDKSNVSFVIHYNMPKSPEAYYQEAGRAGRDGEKADCILLFSPKDIMTAKFLINNAEENVEMSEEEKQQVLKAENERLDAMVTYCNTTGCLRKYMLKYFSQGAEEFCDNCGNCRVPHETVDVTESAVKILHCIREVRLNLGYSTGETFIIKVLRASQDKRITENRLQNIKSYGAMKEYSADEIRSIFDKLIFSGLAERNEFDAIVLTKKADSVIFGKEKVYVEMRRAEEKKKTAKRIHSLNVGDVTLYDILRAVRMRVAREEKVPAYIIFSNATLSDMAEKAPVTMEEFLEVSGVGEVKARLYGDIFINEIKKYVK